MTGETLQKIFAGIKPAEGITEKGKTVIAVFSADNGIAAGCQDKTYEDTMKYLTADLEADILVTDVGSAKDYPDELITLDPIVHNCSDGICRQTLSEQIVLRKIAYGTADISKGPAMTADDACKAIYIGLEAAKAASNAGYKVMHIREAGAGNDITAAAVLSILKDEDACEAARAALERIEKKDNEFDQTVEILRQAGGFSLAAMTGAFLGAALYGICTVIDGDASQAAALCACRINPLAEGYAVQMVKGE